jgi:hypothetical protein
MSPAILAENTDPYARCIADSKKVRWDTDRDVLRGRRFEIAHKLLPNGRSRVHELPFPSTGAALPRPSPLISRRGSEPAR